jgi:hypothetical protein
MLAIADDEEPCDPRRRSRPVRIDLFTRDHVQRHIDEGQLVRVLADWCAPFTAYHHYLPQAHAGATVWMPLPRMNLLLACQLLSIVLILLFDHYCRPGSTQ